MRQWLLAITAILLAIGPTAFAEPITYEHYAKRPALTDVSISMSGNYYSFLRSDSAGSFIIIVEAKSLKPVGSIDVSDFPPTHSYFIDDNNLVFFPSINTRDPSGTGRFTRSAAFLYNIKTQKKSQLLIPGKHIYRWQSGVGGITGFSKNRRYAYMPAFMKIHNGSITNNLLKVDLKNIHRKPRIQVKGTEDTTKFFISTSGDPIARERYDNDRDLHQVEIYQKGKWKQVYKSNSNVRERWFSRLTQDEKSLVFITDKNSDRVKIYLMDLATGKSRTSPMNKEGFDIESVYSDNNKRFIGVRYSGFKPSYQFQSAAANQLIEKIQAAFSDSSVYLVDKTDDWQHVLFKIEGNQSSGEYLLYKEGRLEYLGPQRSQIPKAAIHPVSITDYKARDGLEIPLLVTTPRSQTTSDQALPAIVLPHGGPESYDSFGFDWQAQYFAEKGYIVLQPQFRGSSGFGKAFTNKGYGKWGKEMQNDLEDAIEHYAKLGKIDRQRVCIVGASYGGYAALAGVTLTPDIYRCSVAINPVSDVKKMLKDEKRQHGKDHWVVSYWEQALANGDVSTKHLKDISPINHVKHIKAPILLVHAKEDAIVPYSQSVNMRNALEQSNKAFEFIALSDEDHYLASEQSRLKVLAAIDVFLNTHNPVNK